jgi:high-affinity nickel-transport protein
MISLPLDLYGLILMVFVLGVRHGFDADHLAMIDGFSRSNANTRPLLARWCGLLFSLGHGAVVTVVSALVGMAAGRWVTPDWLDAAGTCISAAFLFTIGISNLAGVIKAAPTAVVQPVGLRARWLQTRIPSRQPLIIAATGALFALSFDTISQVALFAVAAKAASGMLFCVALGLIFTLGMVLTDGINGIWISKVLRRADRRARVASRVMGLTIGATSVLIGLYIVARATVPELQVIAEGTETSSGLLVVAVVLMSALVAERLASREMANGG